MMKNKLQEELKNMIELAEQRRIDKNIITENIFKSQFLFDLQTEFLAQKEYINKLEETVQNYLRLFSTI